MSKQELDILETMAQQGEAAFGVSFPPGHHSGLRSMGHLFEPLRVLHKPLAVYLTIHALALSVDVVVACWGFRKRTVGGVACWVRLPHRQTTGDAAARGHKRTWMPNPLVVARAYGKAATANHADLASPLASDRWEEGSDASSDDFPLSPGGFGRWQRLARARGGSASSPNLSAAGGAARQGWGPG